MGLRRMSAARHRKTRNARRPLALEGLEQRQLLAIWNVTSNLDSVSGAADIPNTLRWAMDKANGSGNDTITFAITGSTTINLLQPLPSLTDPGTFLDGTTQTGYNKANGRPLVVVNGLGLSSNTPTPGISATGGNITIKGLVVQNFNGNGVTLSGSGGDVVQDCYIGTNAFGLPIGTNQQPSNIGSGILVAASNCTIGGTGVTQRNVIAGNLSAGIQVTANRATIQGNYIGVSADGVTGNNNSFGIQLVSSVGDQIGGAAAGQGNVIAGNVFDGINIFSGLTGATTGDVIQGNFIGTDASGNTALQNGGNGIQIFAAGSITVGGTGAAGNVISGNANDGVFLFASQVTNVVVAGNKIGVGADGTTPIPNKQSGVLSEGSVNNTIGGATPSLGNIIANNGTTGIVSPISGFGVAVENSQGVAVLTNSIHDNINGGISQANNGSNLQVPPVLTGAATAAGQTQVAGTLTVDPTAGGDTDFLIQFFSNHAADPAGMFEGQVYLGQTTIHTDLNGNATFNVRLPVGTSVGDQVTATATQITLQNTSAFSAAVPITVAPTTDLTETIATSSSPLLLGGQETYTVTIANTGTTDDTNVVYTGLLDTNSTFVSASATLADSSVITPSQANGIITANLGTIPAGQSATVTIVVTANSTGEITLTSTALGDLIDTTPANNTDVLTTVTVNPAANLQLTIASNPNPVAVGTNLTYVITIVDIGPNDATNAIASVTLPASVSIVNVNPSQGDFTENGNVISFTLGDIAAFGSASITIDVTPNQAGQISTTATTSSDVADPDSGDNTKTNVTSVQQAVNLAVAASAAPNPGTAGQLLTFNLTVSNGPLAGSSISDATAVVVRDTLPANIDPSVILVNPSQGTFTIANGVVTINFGTITVGQAPPTASITVKPLSSGFYTNSATVSDAAEINVGTGPTTATTTVPVSPSDLSVTVVASPTTAAVNASLTYTVTVTNNGPAAAPGVVLVDALPGAIMASPLFSASQGTVSIAGSRITVNVGTLAAGHSATLTIVVVPTLSGPIDDIAGVASANVDPNTANNIFTNTTLVSPVNLVVSGVASLQTAFQGDPLVYGFTVYNAGPAMSIGTGINIAIPANSNFVSSFTTQGFTGYSTAFHILSAAIGNLAPGAFTTVFVTVIPTATGAMQAVGAASTANFNTNAANNFAVVSNTATNLPGTFALSSASYAGLETAGTIPITINRTDGTLGAIDVSYATAPGTAVAGVNFTPVSGTLHFGAGQTSATVLVPVKHDAAITPNLNFFFAITGVNNGASLGTPAAASVTIVNTDRDVTPPLVNGVVPVVSGNSVLAYVIDFSKPLDPARASNPNNYGLFLSGRDLGAANAFIPVAASYNAANFSVTLFPAQPVMLNAFYGLIINGGNANGLTDVSGNFLDGAGVGFAGTNYGALIGYGTSLTYYDAANNLVNLATSGTQMEVVRNFSGNAYEVQLFGNNGHAVMAGSVRGGSTSIAEIDGLGPFGSVNTNGLNTPPFFVAISNFNAPMPVPQTVATAALIGDTVPNGPAYVNARLKAKAAKA
jgi:uncharacterized repeat protein (TIGR01451 family)